MPRPEHGKARGRAGRRHVVRVTARRAARQRLHASRPRRVHLLLRWHHDGAGRLARGQHGHRSDLHRHWSDAGQRGLATPGLDGDGLGLCVGGMPWAREMGAI